MWSSVCRSLAAALLACTFATTLTAQEFRATVKGQVVDPSHASVPGVTVTVQNQDTNEIVSAVTNSDGAYTIPFLRPGLYTLNADVSGFQKYIRKDMRLEVSQTAIVNIQLAVAGVTEQTTVTAESPLLDSGNANRGTVIDSHRIDELPLQSRSPMALTVLVAGVNYNAQAIYLRPFDNGALADWSMNGGQDRNNEFLLDGAPNNANQGGNNIAYVPPADAVPLSVEGVSPDDLRAWRLGKNVYLRTRYTLLSPEWTASEAEGGLTVYAVPQTPVVLFSVNGRTVSALLKDPS